MLADNPEHSGTSQSFQDKIDSAARDYCRLAIQVRAVLVWPAANEKSSRIGARIAQFSDVVFRWDTMLSHEELVEFVRTVYRREAWVGSPDDGFQGARNKALWCEKQGNALALLIVEPHAGVDLLLEKAALRDEFGLEKNSVHISDTHGETVEICEAFWAMSMDRRER
jgi:hypothetical protein